MKQTTTIVLTAALSAALTLSSSSLSAAPAHSLNPKEGMRQINGTQLYWYAIGRGAPVVVLHGGPGLDHTYLLPQLKELAKHFRLIFFDQRGSGMSSVEVDSASMTMSTFVSDLEGIRRSFHLGRMNLLGHSWGGLLAMFYAVRYPDRLKSLILVDPTPATSALRDSSFRAIGNRMSKKDSLAYAELVVAPRFQQRDPRTMDRFFRILFRGTFFDPRLADSLTLTLNKNYPKQSRLTHYLYGDPMLRKYDLNAGLRMLHCPALIIAGDHDPIPPDAFREIHRNIRMSRLVLLKDCGHFPFIEAPRDFFRAVTAFLHRTN